MVSIKEIIYPLTILSRIMTEAAPEGHGSTLLGSSLGSRPYVVFKYVFINMYKGDD